MTTVNPHRGLVRRRVSARAPWLIPVATLVFGAAFFFGAGALSALAIAIPIGGLVAALATIDLEFPDQPPKEL